MTNKKPALKCKTGERQVRRKGTSSDKGIWSDDVIYCKKERKKGEVGSKVKPVVEKIKLKDIYKKYKHLYEALELIGYTQESHIDDESSIRLKQETLEKAESFLSEIHDLSIRDAYYKYDLEDVIDRKIIEKSFKESAFEEFVYGSILFSTPLVKKYENAKVANKILVSADRGNINEIYVLDYIPN